jgi:hypothetical protein
LSSLLSTPIVGATEDPTIPVDPTVTPEPPLPTGPLPSLRPAPAGTWTSIKWIAIPGGHSPAIPAVNEEAAGSSNGQIEGWSKGYIEFVWNPVKRQLTPWGSADGLRWRSGPMVNLGRWASEFKDYDAANDGSDPDYHDACTFAVNLDEAAGRLLIDGTVSCTGGGCGSDPWTTTDLSWTSSDGLEWLLDDTLPAPYSSIAAGGNGFISIGDAKTLYVSTDARTWSKGSLPSAVLTPGSWANSPVSISGGYVLPGVLMIKKGHQNPGWAHGGGCMAAGVPPTDLSLYQAALWWSPDVTTWTRDTLVGTTSSYNGVDMILVRMDDHTLIAQESINNTTLQWASHDGRTWVAHKGAPLEPWVTIASHDHSLFQCPTPTDTTGSDSGLCTLDTGFKVLQLAQGGDIPWDDADQMVLGPSGLLVTGDGSRFWVGSPSA